MIEIPLNLFRESKSLSPVTKKSTFLAIAHSKILLSAMSQYTDIFSVNSTKLMLVSN
jgi:hypothetical protein